MSTERIDYTGKPFSDLPFVYRRKRGKVDNSDWAVEPTTDYLHACTMGRRYAAHFLQWMKQSGNCLGCELNFILSDMAPTLARPRNDDDATHGYAVGFVAHLERFIRHGAASVDVWGDLEREEARAARVRAEYAEGGEA